MKKLILLLLLCSKFLSAQTIELNKYSVAPNHKNCTPSFEGKAGTGVDFYFKLDSSWQQLYLNTDNSTQKICGVSNTTGSDNYRLGVRRAPVIRSGLIAVAYTHINGKYLYPALLDSTGKPLLLYYNVIYRCKIFQVTNGWKMQIYCDNILLSSMEQPVKINAGLFGRRISGIYIEVGDKPCLWWIFTYLQLLN